ncbi:hypothetical protein DERF_015949 [Dermatophagoides farinae]|uniref:Uncharacterized protein n=1 Tax=Dermatophagoides farinae TaxID=6954 RepID=A0A922HKU4_DERFA|nr:hypothetical protein DERF_015949 [Dermatophagoides farinae]
MESVVIQLFEQLLVLSQQRINDWSKIDQLQGLWNTYRLSCLDPSYDGLELFLHEFQSKIDELDEQLKNGEQIESLSMLDKIIEKLNLDIDDSDEKIRLTMQNCQMDKLVRKKIIRFLKQKYKSSNFTIDNETSTMSTTTTIDGQESETQITPNPSAPPLTTTIEIVESNPIVQMDSPPPSPLAITDHPT